MTSPENTPVQNRGKLSLSGQNEDVIRKAKIRALTEGTSLSAVIADWLERYYVTGTHVLGAGGTGEQIDRLEAERAALLSENTVHCQRLRSLERLAARWKAGGPDGAAAGQQALAHLAGMNGSLPQPPPAQDARQIDGYSDGDPGAEE